jgi:recombination protein RecA
MAISKDFIKNIRKETGSVSFAESKYVEPNEWIDTGSYDLNRIMSGDLYKGIPAGRIVVIGGETSTLKSYVAATILSNALKKNKYETIFYFDSEGGALYEFIKGQGCELTKIEQILVDSLEDCTVKTLKTLFAINEEQKNFPSYKALVIIDSLGNLQPNKVMIDAVEKSRQVMDQGGRARLCNQFSSAITIPALRSNSPVLIMNSIFDDTQAMYKSKLLNQSGGKKMQHVGSIILQSTKRFEKDEDKDKEAFFKGSNIMFFTTKNRFARPFYEANVYLDFKKGVHPYSGLFDVGVRYGAIQQSGAWYQVGSDEKKYRRDEILADDSLWKSGLLDKINEKSKQELSYSSTEIAELIEEEKKEVMEAVVTEETIVKTKGRKVKNAAQAETV